MLLHVNVAIALKGMYGLVGEFNATKQSKSSSCVSTVHDLRETLDERMLVFKSATGGKAPFHPRHPWCSDFLLLPRNRVAVGREMTCRVELNSMIDGKHFMTILM